MIASKLKTAETTMKHKLSVGLFSGGEGNDITGLLAICDDGKNFCRLKIRPYRWNSEC